MVLTVGSGQLSKTDRGGQRPRVRWSTARYLSHEKGVGLRFIVPGKPSQNVFVESFNGRFRDECLNQHWFVTLADAQSMIKQWRQDYNTVRPRSSLGCLTPEEFARSRVA